MKSFFATRLKGQQAVRASHGIRRSSRGGCQPIIQMYNTFMLQRWQPALAIVKMMGHSV